MHIDSWGATILIRTLFSFYSSYMSKAHFVRYDLLFFIIAIQLLCFLVQVVRAFVCVCVLE